MFYHQSILNRRGGVFGTVWLAATIKDEHVLKRRDVTRVNLCKTCEDILDYIMVRKQPSVRGRSRPRFSLYLSAKLMFGCVRLYKKQTQYLLEDITSFLVKVRLAANIAENIDLNIACRPDHVTMQDIVELTTEKQPFYDPYFGKITDYHEDYEDVQKLLTELSSPGSDSSMERLRRHRGSEASSSIQIESEQSFLKSALGSPHTVSSLDQITLKEIDIPNLPKIAEQTELPPLDEQNIQALLNESARMDTLHPVDTSHQPDVAIPLGESSVKASEALISLSSPQKTTKEAKELEEQIMSPKEKTPRGQAEELLPEAPPAIRELRPRSQPEVTLMPPPEEEPYRSSRKRRIDMSLELAPLPPSPRTVKRRRRHLIVDENMMIPKTEMKKNLQTGSDLCKPFSVPVIGRSDCATLFNQPGSKCLRLSPLIDLWRCNLRPGVLETESDIETPFWTVPSIFNESTRSKRSRRALLSEPEVERRDVQPEIPDIQMTEIQPPQLEIPLDKVSPEKVRADISMGNEMPSMEIPRDASISMEKSLQDTTPIQLHLSARSKDDSLSDRSTASRKRRSRSRGSIEEELLVPPSEHSVSDTFSRISRNLSVVQEESEIPMVDTPLPIISKLSQVESRFLRLINSNTSEKDYSTFEEVCPPHFYDRKIAASMFNALLHLCAKGNVYVDQREPYGEMLIQRGHNF
ncbi:meiotic recombination protein REC8 homolog isoform X2 [Saccostrea echinata]|uniref:meiotic recombination protein REC8 homolog isoform X2 n=1 Tax=Saccostrea echinata TaxID=191078 RepID=UPI002A7ED7C3|nr:meiotic recombination protein REC8 homolog isoform X2 [Saccostrea echinata]